ncbi:hypothetical protein BDQ17DRAFT_1545139 [Cyathus striatus]|nr:hypothetical protein BDQ17DRAFT_1545139 [Cyathus striatus]
MKIKEPYQQQSVGVTSVAASDGHAEGLHRVEQLPNKLVANEIPIGSDSIAISHHARVKQPPVKPGTEQNVQQNCVGDNGSATWHLYAEDLGGALVEHIMEDNQHVVENIPFVDDNALEIGIHGHAKPAIPHPLSDHTSGGSNGEFVINGKSSESLPLAECMLAASGIRQILATTGDQIVNNNVVDISQHQNTAESGVIAVLCDSWSTTTEARVTAVSSDTRSVIAGAESEAGEASDNQAYITLVTTNNALMFVAGLCSLLAAFQPLAKQKNPAAGWHPPILPPSAPSNVHPLAWTFARRTIAPVPSASTPAPTSSASRLRSIMVVYPLRRQDALTLDPPAPATPAPFQRSVASTLQRSPASLNVTTPALRYPYLHLGHYPSPWGPPTFTNQSARHSPLPFLPSTPTPTPLGALSCTPRLTKRLPKELSPIHCQPCSLHVPFKSTERVREGAVGVGADYSNGTFLAPSSLYIPRVISIPPSYLADSRSFLPSTSPHHRSNP